MSISDRRKNEIKAFKKKVIAAAGEIVIDEGYEKLSIRKIAEKIEYSPGIIYHYFKDKNEILSYVVQQNYGEIIKLINKFTIDKEYPEKTIEKSMREYINIMLNKPEAFKSILINGAQEINEKVNVLERGISQKRESMKALTGVVSYGINIKRFRQMDPEVCAQVIWTATYGLIARIIIEGNVSAEQRERLIDEHFEILMKGIVSRE